MSWPTNVPPSHPVLPSHPFPSPRDVAFPDALDSDSDSDLVLADSGATASPIPARVGVGHSKRVKLLAFHCALCDVHANDEVSYQNHLHSGRHRAMVERDARDREPIDRRRRPVHRRPDLSATSQLIRIIDNNWGSFATETVTAMFLLRTKRHYFLKDSQRLTSAQTVEQFAVLILAAPRLIVSAAPLVRAHLACVDLPEDSPAPTLVLSTDARRRLQQDCLFRDLRQTVLADSPKLILLAAARAIEDGTAEALLSDPFRALLSDFAHVVWSSAMIPGSAYHWAWHDFHSVPIPGALTRSYSADSVHQLSERSCTCAIREADLTLLRTEQRQREREFAEMFSLFDDDLYADVCLDELTLE